MSHFWDGFEKRSSEIAQDALQGGAVGAVGGAGAGLLASYTADALIAAATLGLLQPGPGFRRHLPLMGAGALAGSALGALGYAGLNSLKRQKQASVAKALAEGLVGGELSAAHVARRVGRGIRKATAPVAAAGGGVALTERSHRKHKEHHAQEAAHPGNPG